MARTSLHNDDYGIPDYDFGDSVFYKKPKSKKHTRDNDIAVLVIMCLCAFLMLGVFVLLRSTPGLEFKLGSFFSMIGATEHPGYQLGNIKLGTTMDVLRAQQPNAQKGVTSNGSITLTFQDQEADYTVWYAEDGPYHIAYKARQNRVVSGMSEDEYIGTIAKLYGAPSVSTCSRRITDGMRDCRFSWWMPGELRLDLNSRQDLSDLKSRLVVTMVATDTHLEGRIRRAQLSTSIERH